ncbi:MAG: HPF/RaiA family ribosome-associated protein, partial [Gammaproteobacteria bacterium]
CDDIVSCHITLERAQHNHQTGNPYRTRIELRLPPNKDLVADKEGEVENPQVQLRPIIRAAFEAIERQLKRQTQKRRREVKRHDEPVALVEQLFPEQGYGFLRTPEGREIYFHRNSVLHDDFTRLEIGTGVRFALEMGEDGPQASTVQIVDKPGVRRRPALP